MPFVNFRKKIRFFSFDFRQNFDVRTFPWWLSIRGTKFFWWAIQKFFFFKIFTLVLLDGFLDGFWKFRLFIFKICILMWYFSKIVACVCWAYAETILLHAEHTRNRFYRILGTNFRACSACGKMWTVFTCTVHAQHTRNEFYRTLSIRGTNFIACWAYLEPISSHAEHISAESNTIFKNLVLQALGTTWFRFLQKKSKKNVMLVYL